jgi:hypothetical protein
MKKIWIVFALLLFGAVTTIAVAGSGRESTMLPPQEVQIMYTSEDHAYQIKDISSVVRWKVLSDGSMAFYNSSGVTTATVRSNTGSDAPTIINSRSQLSTFSGAGIAGQSYYQTQPGVRYWVDPISIGYSGVTMMLPNATEANSGGTVSIELVTTGATGYQAWAGAEAGTTNVFVYPYSAGTTKYYYNASIGVTPQTMARSIDALQGVTMTQTSKTMGSGGGGTNIYYTLDYPHESAEFGLQNASQVSSYVIRSRTLN